MNAQTGEEAQEWCGHFSFDINGNCMRCAREAERRGDMTQAWNDALDALLTRADEGIEFGPENYSRLVRMVRTVRKPPTEPAADPNDHTKDQS